jgi:hypothetical protein
MKTIRELMDNSTILKVVLKETKTGYRIKAMDGDNTKHFAGGCGYDQKSAALGYAITDAFNVCGISPYYNSYIGGGHSIISAGIGLNALEKAVRTTGADIEITKIGKRDYMVFIDFKGCFYIPENTFLNS